MHKNCKYSDMKVRIDTENPDQTAPFKEMPDRISAKCADRYKIVPFSD